MSYRRPTGPGPGAGSPEDQAPESRHPRPTLSRAACPRAHSQPTAITLRSPYCLANVPRTPQRTPRPHTFSPMYPKKGVTLPLHPFPALSFPTPRTSHLFPTPTPFLPTNPPKSRILASPIETHAHPCYPRPSEGPTPQPGNPIRNRGRPQASVGAPKTSHRPPTRPLSCSVTRCHFRVPKRPLRHYRFAQDRRTLSYETHRMSQNRTEFTSRLRGNNLVGGAK